MSDLLANIRSCLPWIPPDSVDDIISEIAILVLEGRIDEHDIKSGIRRYLPILKKKYKGIQFDISLDQPIGDEQGAATLGDVIHEPAPLARLRCPNCRKKVKPKRTYCSRECGCKYRQRIARKIDPIELAELNKVRWLSRERMAKIFGVTKHGINNVISRHKLTRFLPEFCKIPGCNNPVDLIKNHWGNMVGNLCKEHRREAARAYTRKFRLKTHPPKTKEERSAQARLASLQHWERIKPNGECTKGHTMNDDNVYVYRGNRRCKLCILERNRRWYKKNRSKGLK